MVYACEGYDEVVVDIFAALATLPSLLRDVRAYRQGNTSVTRAALMLAARTYRCKALRHAGEFEASLKSGTAAYEALSTDPDYLFPLVYHFADRKTAATYCLHWSSIIIANRLIGVVDPECGLEQESKEAAKRICMSVEQARNSRPFAAFHMSFALPVAFSVASESERAWIHSHLMVLFEDIHLKYSMEILHVLAVLITGVPVDSNGCEMSDITAAESRRLKLADEAGQA